MRPFQFDHYAPSTRGPLQVQDGSTWRALPLLRNVGFSPTTPSETTTEFVDSPSQTRSGSSGPGNATYDINRTPSLRAYKLCYDAFKAGTELTFRDWGGEPVVEAGVGQLAVATSGVGTLSGGASAGSETSPATAFTPGRVVYTASTTGSQVLTIERVTGNDELELSRLGTITTAAGSGQPAIVTPDDESISVGAAAAYTISRYATMREFTGRVTSLGGYTRGASNEGQVDQLVVNVLSFPDEMIVVAPGT